MANGGNKIVNDEISKYERMDDLNTCYVFSCKRAKMTDKQLFYQNSGHDYYRSSLDAEYDHH